LGGGLGGELRGSAVCIERDGAGRSSRELELGPTLATRKKATAWWRRLSSRQRAPTSSSSWSAVGATISWRVRSLASSNRACARTSSSEGGCARAGRGAAAGPSGREPPGPSGAVGSARHRCCRRVAGRGNSSLRSAAREKVCRPRAWIAVRIALYCPRAGPLTSGAEPQPRATLTNPAICRQIPCSLAASGSKQKKVRRSSRPNAPHITFPRETL
jgi:hypothetical protein